MADESKDTPINLDALPDGAFVTDLDLAAAFRVHQMTIWKWSKSGQLPKPYRLGGNTTRWKVGEVRLAIAQKAA